MFAQANQAHFSLSIEGVEHDLQVLEFSGREAISQPYAFVVDLISTRPDLDLESLLQQRAFLAFEPHDAGIHGLIQSIEQGESDPRMTRYRLTLAPQLAYLAYRSSPRIFQQLTVAKIIGQLLEEHGIQADAYRFQLGSRYPERDYCVQYGESDLHFVQRLCEEEGIHYHFRHSRDGHLLLFGDDQSVFPCLAPLAYQQDTGLVADEPVIQQFGVRVDTRSNQVSRRDYDFKKPRVQLEAKAVGDAQPKLEDYDYPGRYSDRERGKHLARRALERHRHDVEQAQGGGDSPTLLSGHLLTLTGHPREEWNQRWLLTEVRHAGKQPQVLEELAPDRPARLDGRGSGGEGQTGDGDFSQGYRNRFTATPWDVPYRPPLAHAKPRILGSQSAVVTGPAGEDIHCDEYGRVKVQFFWDRQGQADAKTSCWLRVSSSWAGDRYGAIRIPRIGMEVLVSFLEGDPDQPLVTGCLYHAEHVVPYDLPAHKTRSVFKSLSSPGGGGYNELRIEDRQGMEQIYLHAQRDWDETIEHDQKIRVGHERHDTVDANSYTELKAEEHLSVSGERKVEVKPQDHLSVATDQHLQLGTAQLTRAGREIHLKAGQKLVIEAGSELTLKAGGSFIKLDPGGISLSGAQARLNAGGAPGKGSGLKIKPPRLPGMAARDKAGRLLAPAQPGELVSTPKKRKRTLNFSG